MSRRKNTLPMEEVMLSAERGMVKMVIRGSKRDMAAR